MDYNHCRVSEGDFKKFSGFLAVGYKVGGFLPPTPNSVTLALFLILSPVMRFVFFDTQMPWRAGEPGRMESKIILWTNCPRCERRKDRRWLKVYDRGISVYVCKIVWSAFNWSVEEKAQGKRGQWMPAHSTCVSDIETFGNWVKASILEFVLGHLLPVLL